MTALELLKTVFGYSNFRGQQQAVIDAVLAGADVLALMPTGGGKSLCFQIPALLKTGTAVVVSPLIALMQDQVAALRELGVEAAYINSALSNEQLRQSEQALRQGQYRLVYIAPERLLSPRLLAMLDFLAERGSLSLFAIDEAHCISAWGHDFRPEYIQLSQLTERYPQVPVIALTATADEATREEILLKLGLRQPQVFIDSFDRPNLCYRIVDKHQSEKQLLDFIRQNHPGKAGIVYCSSRQKVEDITEFLCSQQIDALSYHAGLSSQLRQRNQERFVREDAVVMVATIAFGMGIDKPDVRFVAHLDLPKSVEGYYQETGRAGRDGFPADAWMSYGLTDALLQRRLIEQSEADDHFKRLSLKRLNQLLAICESATCRRQRLLAYFGQSSESCGNCDTCLEPPQCFDGTELAQKALSCVYRTGQKFGAGHVIDVLMGRDQAKVRQWQHHTLSTYGIGRELSAKQWQVVFRQLLALEYLHADAEHGSLQLTESSRELLKGQQRLMLRHTKASTRTSKRSPSVETDLDAAGRELFQRLKAWRAETAKSHGVPAYVIFHDSTLSALAQLRPQHLDQLGSISGIGEKKREHYGEELLRLCAEQ